MTAQLTANDEATSGRAVLGDRAPALVIDAAVATAARIADEAIRQIEELHIGDLVTSGLPYAVAALAAARDGERARALHPLRLAERALERRGGGLPFDSMLLNMTVAETAIELDRTDLAVRHLSLARAALATLGDGGRAERRLNRLVRRSERVVDTGSDADGPTAEPLTAREVQVLGCSAPASPLRKSGSACSSRATRSRSTRVAATGS